MDCLVKFEYQTNFCFSYTCIQSKYTILKENMNVLEVLYKKGLYKHVLIIDIIKKDFEKKQQNVSIKWKTKALVKKMLLFLSSLLPVKGDKRLH